MVEKVARALCAVDGRVPGDLAWVLYKKEARAAIEAMRHPTTCMAMATLIRCSGTPCGTEDEAIRAFRDHLWPAAIDEALEG